MKSADANPVGEALDYEDLVDRMEGPLTKFVFGYIHDRHATQDLVQETFLRVFRNLHRYQGQSSLSTWVHSIARNLCLDYLKSSSRSRLRFLDVEPELRERTPTRSELPDSLCGDPFRPIEREENCARVGRALTALAPESRDLVILRVFLGRCPLEIARDRHTTSSKIRSRLARALKSLSEELQ